MEMEQSVPKRRHIKFRRRGITQKKACNMRDGSKVIRPRVLNRKTHEGQQLL